jgi:hypothetical protein
MACSSELVHKKSLRQGGGFCPGRARLLTGGHSLGLGVLATEALNAARGVDQLLFAGEERVAVGANFGVDIAFVRGARGEVVTARADHANLVIVRMDPLLRHDSKTLSLQSSYFSGKAVSGKAGSDETGSGDAVSGGTVSDETVSGGAVS